MAKDYFKLCPNLSKFISQTDIEIDFAPKAKPVEIEPVLTKEKVEQAYAMLKVDPQYLPIAYAVGLTEEQVKELHQEMIIYKNCSEPIIK